MITVSDRLDGRNNNFNLIRVIAAALVIYDHSFPLTLGLDANGQRRFEGEWLYDLSGGLLNCGGVGVSIFFVISGFLVAKSLDRSATLGEFAAARVLRIYPALVVNVALTVLLLGSFFTTLPLDQYFGSASLLGFVWRNATMLTTSPPTELPGVFEHNPYPHSVNGALWTLPWELGMYLSLAALALLGLFRRRRALSAAIVALLGVYALILAAPHRFQVPFAVFFAIHFTSHFYLGAFIYLNRERVPCSALSLWASGTALLLAVLLIKAQPRLLCLVPPLLGYFALCFALVPRGKILAYNRLGDYSYGLYIFGFPIQQSLVALLPQLQALQLFGLALGLTWLVAMLSWHFVEKPMLALKHRPLGITKHESVVTM